MQACARQCPTCISARVVWNWTDGDIICTGCGLVLEERFIDDRVPASKYSDYKYDEPKLKKNVVASATMIGVDMPDSTLQLIQQSCREKFDKPTVAASIYNTVKGMTAKQICSALDIKPSKFWKAASTSKTADNKDILRRTIYECDVIPKDKVCVVMKTAISLFEALEKSNINQSLRKDRLAVSLLILSCEMLGIFKKRNVLCKTYKISMETVRKHEYAVQQALRLTHRTL